MSAATPRAAFALCGSAGVSTEKVSPVLDVPCFFRTEDGDEAWGPITLIWSKPGFFRIIARSMGNRS